METPMETLGLQEPVPRGLAGLLRRAVLEHASSETRRAVPPCVHVGVPGLVTASLELPDAADPADRLDQALRVDVLEALVRRVRRPGPPPLIWLTRRGPVQELQDLDAAWSSAAATAGAELGTALVMVSVDRHSWRDPRSGVGRTWKRARDRRTPPGVGR